MKHNHESPHESDSNVPRDMDVVMYNDGHMALAYQKEGDELRFGLGGLKYGQDFGGPEGHHGSDLAILHTEKGNVLGLGRGQRVDYQTEIADRFTKYTDDMEPLVIGQPWSELGQPYVDDPVTSVQLQYKISTPDYPHNITMAEPNPFEDLSDRALLAETAQDMAGEQ